MSSSKLSRQRLEEMRKGLSERDRQILGSLLDCRCLTTKQVQRLHVYQSATPSAAMNATTRNMNKLEGLGLARRLEHRIGGVRAGSQSIVWTLTEAGRRLSSPRVAEDGARKRFAEPSPSFLRHLLAVSECYVGLVEICRQTTEISLQEVQHEPKCWRPYQSAGRQTFLKPDLFTVTVERRGTDREGVVDEYEDRWFWEVDRGTESLSAVVEKCRKYHEYYRTGLEQQKCEVFPATIWIVPDRERKERLLSELRRAFRHQPRLFAVIEPHELEALVRQELGAEIVC